MLKRLHRLQPLPTSRQVGFTFYRVKYLPHKFHLVNFLFFTFYLSFISCKRENSSDCFKSTGNIIKEERVAGDIKTIELKSSINLIISQDTVNKITVEAGENLLPLIITEMNNDTLVIKNNNKCNWVRSFKKAINVYLTVTDLAQITSYGSGDITSTNTLTNNFFMLEMWTGGGSANLNINASISNFKIHTGSGDITVKGFSNFNYIYIRSNGWMWCDSLFTNYTEVNSLGTGDCYVNTYQTLNVSIYYKGNVYYSGNPPKVNAEITGSGELIRQ